MRIFGKDGDGYELTVRLENAGSLKEWLGVSSHSKLRPHLTSQAAWHSFMNSTSSPLLNLQMRVRALLFDKAAGCVYEDFGETIAPSSLNPSYLQLNRNAVYFPLDQDAEDFKRYQANAVRTPTTPFRHQPYLAKSQNMPGQHAHNSSKRSFEDGPEVKGGGSISQQRHASQAGHSFNNMINSKQEMSKPSLNKVKKVEAWDSSDATKRPMEMIGTINKKLRSPKISSKATFQTDGTGVPVRDHQEKTGNHKITGGFARCSEENSRGSSLLPVVRAAAAPVETGDVGPLWYDQCAKSYLSERMQRLAQRTAQQKLPFPEREGFSRTPEGMVAYIEFNAKRQKTLCVVKPDADTRGSLPNGQTQDLSNESEKVKGDLMFVPDLKFLANCVPDNPVPAKRRKLEKWDDGPKGLLDRLDELPLPSPNASNGVRRDKAPLTSESRALQGKQDVKTKKDLCFLPSSSQSDKLANKVREHDAENMLRQTVSKLVADAGFEGLKQSSLDLFVDVLDSRFKKLSSGLRVMIDNYRRQCSQAEYMKMFIQISGSSMEDLMEQVKVGVQKQQLLEQQRQEQEQLLLQKQQREEEELQQQKQRREQEELEQRKLQREQEELQQQKLQQEEQRMKQLQAEEQQSQQQQQQNTQKQRQVEHRQSDQQHPHSQQSQQQQHSQKLRQPEQQPPQLPQQPQQTQKQRQPDQQHSQQQSQQPQQQHSQKQRQPDQQQQQQSQKQRQPDQHHSQQQPQPHQHSQKPRQSEYQHAQQQQLTHFPNHKRRPQPTQSPSRQSLSGKQAGMRPPSAPSAIDSVLKQARKACSETMEQHKQKADQVMGLIKQNPQQASVDMMASPKQGLTSPGKGLLKKSPDAYQGLLNQRQPVSQQSSAEKAQKRKQQQQQQQQQSNVGRHSPNMGRNPKKVEKERPLDGKSLGETRPVVGKKPMQMMAGGNSSSWHSPIPSVKSQTSPMLQHMKQQASSLQQQ